MIRSFASVSRSRPAFLETTMLALAIGLVLSSCTGPDPAPRTPESPVVAPTPEAPSADAREAEARAALRKLKDEAPGQPLDRQIPLYKAFVEERKGTVVAEEAAAGLAELQAEHERQKAAAAEAEARAKAEAEARAKAEAEARAKAEAEARAKAEAEARRRSEFEQHVAAAREAAARRQWDSFRNSYAKARELDPDDPALAPLEDILRRRGQFETLLADARAALQEEQWLPAKNSLDQARELDADDPELAELDAVLLANVRFSEDQRYLVPRRDETIWDTRTSLQWIVGPNRDTSYGDAERWLGTLRTDDDGWRLPTREEIRSIRETSKRDGYNLDRVFGLDGWVWVWTDDPRDEAAVWGMRLADGSEYANHRTFAYRTRVAAVRSMR